MIKVQLNAGKNIDDMYHFTKTFENFVSICDSLKIYPGAKTEPGPAHKKSDFVCVTRDKNLMQNNGQRYVAGFILDGDKLTDLHELEPISYIGYNLNNNTVSIRVRSVTSYDDGTYTMYIQPFGSLKISEKVYNIITSILEKLPEETKQLKKIMVSTGKRKINGHTIVQKYTVNVPSGVTINAKRYPELTEVVRELAMNENTNEHEERVWNKPINIKQGLKGVILRKSAVTNNLALIRTGLDCLVQHGFKIATDDSELGYADSASFRIFLM